MKQTAKECIKCLINRVRYAKEVNDRYVRSESIELIRVLWRHRHTDKPISAVLVAQRSRTHMTRLA